VVDNTRDSVCDRRYLSHLTLAKCLLGVVLFLAAKTRAGRKAGCMNAT
jgi:hypothetical protein